LLLLTGETKKERRARRSERQTIHIEHDMPRFAGVFQLLQIAVWHALPFNAKAKPVERFFGTYEDQFGRLTHSYCGNKPENKPHHLAERLKKGEAVPFDSYVAAPASTSSASTTPRA